jgi:hypothetical protein
MASMDRARLLREAAMRGKYAPLHKFLLSQKGESWPATFTQIEGILGFSLPNSARIHRPWWANQGGKGAHSHALAWEVAGWRTAEVDLATESLVFQKSP